MDFKIWWIVLSLVQLVIESNAFEATFLKILPDKYLVGHDLYTLDGIEIETHCLVECAKNTKCGSVNYHAVLQTCVINDVDIDENARENDISRSVGWRYAEKSLKAVKKVPMLTEFLFSKEIRVEPGKIINIMPVQRQTWKVNFNMTVIKSTSTTRNIIDFKSKGEVEGEIRHSPKVDLVKGNKIRVIVTPITFEFVVALNQMLNVTILQYTTCHNCPTKVKVLVNGLEVFSQNHESSQQIPVYKNVQCFTSNGYPAPVLISHISHTLKNLFGFGLQPLNVPKERIKLLTLSRWPPKQWYVSVKIKIPATASDNSEFFGPIRFSSDLTDRIPRFVIRKNTGELQISVNHEGSRIIFFNDYIQFDVFVHVRVEQVEENNQLVLRTYVDGVIGGDDVVSSINGHVVYENVGVFLGYENRHNDVFIKEFDYGEIVI